MNQYWMQKLINSLQLFKDECDLIFIFSMKIIYSGKIGETVRSDQEIVWICNNNKIRPQNTESICTINIPTITYKMKKKS